MSEEKKKPAAPPEISPYLFPVILAFLGAWCFYDGFITADPEMLEHQTFNRVCSAILLPWAVIDFIRTRKLEKKAKQSSQDTSSTDQDDT